MKPSHVLVRAMRLSIYGSDIYILDHCAPESYSLQRACDEGPIKIIVEMPE